MSFPLLPLPHVTHFPLQQGESASPGAAEGQCHSKGSAGQWDQSSVGSSSTGSRAPPCHPRTFPAPLSCSPLHLEGALDDQLLSLPPFHQSQSQTRQELFELARRCQCKISSRKFLSQRVNCYSPYLHLSPESWSCCGQSPGSSDPAGSDADSNKAMGICSGWQNPAEP